MSTQPAEEGGDGPAGRHTPQEAGNAVAEDAPGSPPKPPADALPGTPVDGAEAAPAPARRGRTMRLLAAAVLLGLLGGAATGYAIQYNRPPTAHPLLLPQPVHGGRRTVPAHLAADQDDEVKTDGDLRKLLLPRPAGAQSWSASGSVDGWLPLSSFAEEFSRPADAFTEENSQGFRRLADTAWYSGQTSYEIQLIQYESLDEGSAQNNVQERNSNDANSGVTASIPGTVDGWVRENTKPDQSSGGPTYLTEGAARHGDIAVVVYAYGLQPVAGQAVTTLIERQLERL